MKGYGFVMLAALCWATLGPVARLAFAEGVTPLEVAFWRAALGGILFALHAGRRRLSALDRNVLPAVVAFALFGVSLFYGSYQLAVERGGAALASMLLYTAPAWVAVMSAVWLKEQITPGKVAAILLAVAGVAAISLGSRSAVGWPVEAILWGLMAGWCYALYYPFGKRYFEQHSTAVVLALALFIGAFPLLLFVDFASKTAVAWGAILWIAVVSTYVAYLLYGTGLRYIEATRASVVATFEPVMAASLAYLWWDECLGLPGLVGATLILAGVVLSMLGGRLKQRSGTGT